MQQDPRTGSFEILVDGETAGRMEVVTDDGRATIPHVWVEPRFEGRGIGTRLVVAGAERLHADGLAIRPVCSFAARVLRARPDLTEVSR
ncbi:hypothetical protein CLV56_3333 [Mumia flava]|uniref:N-acetyltransferase domain-containing protein n=1 Tax=Mumia flava TaxID=1348852 RepID=A0A0B2B746_9ACTN|nr:hypothetical protein CLV56_3333 [Mumia flava]